MSKPYITKNSVQEQLPLYVIKIGGSLLASPTEGIQEIASVLTQFQKSRPKVRFALVHGGGPHLRLAFNEATIDSRTLEGYRITPKDHIPLVEKTLFSGLYQQFYTHFAQAGLKESHWSSAFDLPLFAAQKKAPCGATPWESVGEEMTWDTNRLRGLIQEDTLILLPSIAPTEDGLNLYNVNADDMAKSLAIALKAQGLIFITDVPGVLNSEKDLIPYLTPDSASILKGKGQLEGGMLLKVEQGFEALKLGVPFVHLCPLSQLDLVVDQQNSQESQISKSIQTSPLEKELIGTSLMLKSSPENNHLMKTYARKPLVFKEGYGPWLVEESGTTYLDMVSGVAVNTLGHAHPKLTEAIESQAGKLLHLSNLYFSPPQLLLSERLCTLSGMNSVFFSNSGAEAVEAALKIARKFGKLNGAYKRKIIHLSGSFHGRTFGALAVTSNVHYQAPFLPLVSETEEIPVNDITTLKRVMSDDVCAIILEPIQGESGVHMVDPAFIAEARALCNQHNSLLIFDEVQCGIGRTGSLFYFEQLGIKPDVLCLAKGLGGGFPLGATLVNSRADVLTPGDHGSTFGGNPLACACGNAILDAIASDALLENVANLGQHIKKHFAKNPHPLIEQITGTGLFLGIHLSVSAGDAVAAAQEKGLLLIGAGAQTVRFLPPLNVTEEVVDLALMRLYCALNHTPGVDTGCAWRVSTPGYHTRREALKAH